MNTPPDEINNHDGAVLDDRFEDLFDREGPTPEELRRADARLKAFAVYNKERPFPDDPNRIEIEKKARATYEAAIAAINAQYEKEMREKESKG